MLCRFENKRHGRRGRVTGPDGNFIAVRRKQIRADREKAMVFTGQPGIGKSWFLAYVLVERLLKGEITRVHYSAGKG
jgi:DNA replication protein DnaC